MSRAGIVIDFESESKLKKPDTEEFRAENPGLHSQADIDEIKDLEIDELKELLEEAIGKENYERASLIRDEINKRAKK
jgi:protein-arginine kinase activator protein McsA